MNKTKARRWEISENLHRAELTKFERDELAAEWISFTGNTEKPAQLAQVSGGRGNEGGLSAATRELGIERTDASEAAKGEPARPELAHGSTRCHLSEPIHSGGQGMIVGAIKGSTRIGYRPPRGVDASLMRRADHLDSVPAG